MHHSTFVWRLLYKIAAFTAKLFANMLFERKEEIIREKKSRLVHDIYHRLYVCKLSIVKIF